MTDMPTTYDTKTTTQSTTSIGLHPEYIRTIPGMLKIVEIVLCIILAITSSINWGFVHLYGGGWVQFVCITALFCTIFFFLSRLINIYHRLPGPWSTIEFIYYALFTLFFLIAAIVAAVKGNWHSSIAATAFFAFAATAVYAVDTSFQFRAYRSSRTEMTTSTTTTTNERNVEATHQTY